MQFIWENSLYQVFTVEIPRLQDPIVSGLIQSELIKAQRLFFVFEVTIPTQKGSAEPEFGSKIDLKSAFQGHYFSPYANQLFLTGGVI